MRTILLILVFGVALAGCDRSAAPSKTHSAKAISTKTKSSALEKAEAKKDKNKDVSLATRPPSVKLEPSLQSSLPSYPPSTKPVKLSTEEWQKKLSPKEYEILREAGTERAFTGDLLNNKQHGIYTCAGCGAPLFASSHKFKSGTGWPSYYSPVEDGRVLKKVDRSHGMVRTEVVCARCEGHLGHVFSDGPQPTGLRYCINSASMNFDPVPKEGDAKKVAEDVAKDEAKDEAKETSASN